MDENELRRLREADLIRREMQRYSMDTIRIYNPLDVDFRFLHDGYPNTVKARSYKDLPRYKATLYFKHMAQYIIGEMQAKKGEELLKKRADRGLDELLDKYQENKQIWDKVPRLDNRELLEELGAQLIIGVVEEYGREEYSQEGRIEPKPDKNDLVDDVFNASAKKKVSSTPLNEPEETIEEFVPVKSEEKGDSVVKPLKKAV